MPGNERRAPSQPRGQKSPWFVAVGLTLTALLGEGGAWAAGEHLPLFWLWVLHPPAKQQLWALRVMAWGCDGIGLCCPQLSPATHIPPRGRRAAKGALTGMKGRAGGGPCSQVRAALYFAVSTSWQDNLFRIE